MEDEKIIELYFERNESAISETAEKYGNYLYKIAFNILSDNEDSEESVNDPYMSAWNTIPPEKPNVFSAFLSKITRYISLNRYRAGKAEKRGGGETNVIFDEISEFVSGKDNPEISFEKKELAKAIDGFLEELQKEKRKIFILRYWYFESIEKIAERTGKTESSIRNSLFRERKKLKKYLSERGFEI